VKGCKQHTLHLADNETEDPNTGEDKCVHLICMFQKTPLNAGFFFKM